MNIDVNTNLFVEPQSPGLLDSHTLHRAFSCLAFVHNYPGATWFHVSRMTDHNVDTRSWYHRWSIHMCALSVLKDPLNTMVTEGRYKPVMSWLGGRYRTAGVSEALRTMHGLFERCILYLSLAAFQLFTCTNLWHNLNLALLVSMKTLYSSTCKCQLRET